MISRKAYQKQEDRMISRGGAENVAQAEAVRICKILIFIYLTDWLKTRFVARSKVLVGWCASILCGSAPPVRQESLIALVS
jgi:hypothetical protein